jgi:hypothetical protein
MIAKCIGYSAKAQKRQKKESSQEKVHIQTQSKKKYNKGKIVADKKKSRSETNT